jgi:hypothetical protein
VRAPNGKLSLLGRAVSPKPPQPQACGRTPRPTRAGRTDVSEKRPYRREFPACGGPACPQAGRGRPPRPTVRRSLALRQRACASDFARTRRLHRDPSATRSCSAHAFDGVEGNTVPPPETLRQSSSVPPHLTRRSHERRYNPHRHACPDFLSSRFPYSPSRAPSSPSVPSPPFARPPPLRPQSKIGNKKSKIPPLTPRSTGRCRAGAGRARR